jgi:two-component system sensor histidine kinase DegS
LLTEAQAIVSELLTRLRGLMETAHQRDEQMVQDVRQAERALDEVTMQQRFAAERNLPTASSLSERERDLRARYNELLRASQQAQHARKQLDQLIRQFDMSSSVLSGSSENGAPDPWMLALRAQVVLGREEERVRLAREVHDSPAQVLANMLMVSEQCRQLLHDQQTDQLAQLLDRMRDATREGLHEVRQFIAELRPGQIQEQGLVPALHDYIRRYCDTYKAQVTFEADALPRLAIEYELVFYRIVQEALQNAHKHAPGATITVMLAIRRGKLLLTVRDDGPGFDPREVARRTGRESWGLTSMRERAELIGARFSIHSRPGRGTEVSVALPVSR